MADTGAVLLITSAGLVGSNLYGVLKKHGINAVETYYPGVDEERGCAVDIADSSSIQKLFARVRPRVAVLSAALTNVEFCEEHPEQARRINVEGCRAVALACKSCDCKLVFFSSEYVFDGKSGPYAEEDIPNPQCVYGKNKLEAEQIIQEALPDYLTIRTTVVFGYEKLGKNFVLRLIKTLQAGRQIQVPRDQISSPTYAYNLAEVVWDLIAKGKKGTYNVVGRDLMDRYAFSLAVCDEFGLAKDLVIPVTTAQLGQKAVRPLKAGLRIDKVSRDSGVSILGVREGLARFKKELYG